MATNRTRAAKTAPVEKPPAKRVRASRAKPPSDVDQLRERIAALEAEAEQHRTIQPMMKLHMPNVYWSEPPFAPNAAGSMGTAQFGHGGVDRSPEDLGESPSELPDGARHTEPTGSGVHSALSEHEHHLDEMAAMVAKLAARLEPVLHPPADEHEGHMIDGHVGMMPPVVGHVRELTSQAQRTMSILQDIHNRLAV